MPDVPDMPTVYRIGETWEGRLPPGDTFGTHVDPGLGVLLLLGAVHRLRTPELSGFRDGVVRLAVGTAPDLVIIAHQFPGWGWSDGAATRLTTQDGPIEEYRELAEEWATGGGRGAVVGVLVDRDAGDAIAALRYFSMSPHVTAMLGRLLRGVYAGPEFTEGEYAARVLAWQADHPDTEKWVRTHALATCRGGD